MVNESALAATSSARKVIAPPKLKPGDTVAIVSPAGAATSAADLEATRAALETKLGVHAVLAPNSAAQWGYLAGSDEGRADDFNWAVNNSDVDAIITLRGGYGTMRMIPHIDYDAFRRNPKIVTGYSDITGLLNALTARSGVITFHGPIAESKYTGFEREWFDKAVTVAQPLGKLGTPATISGRVVEPAPRTIQAGKATGRLVGGNLSLIAACAGTPYLPSFKHAILVLEDTNEDPYRVDRMLTTLHLHGMVGQLAGIVFGDFRPPKPQPVDPAAPPPDKKREFSMDQVIDNLCQWVKCPIFTGLYAGHISDKLTLPIGAMAAMDADLKELVVTESAVSA